MASVTSLEDTQDTPAVRGFLHTPDAPTGHALVLSHGAGSNANAPMLVTLAETFSQTGITVLRCDLPFRQARSHGSPSPAKAAQDRAGIKRAALLLRERLPGKVFLGGHSYGGRQTSMLVADEPALAAGLLLFSYPLHPPGRAADLRTAHFPKLTTPVIFIHGTRDPFGSIAEMQAAIAAIPAAHQLIPIDKTGHDLGGKGPAAAQVAATVLSAFQRWLTA